MTSGLVTDSCLDNIFNTRENNPRFKNINIYESLSYLRCYNYKNEHDKLSILCMIPWVAVAYAFFSC